jgi:hypothetical protein
VDIDPVLASGGVAGPPIAIILGRAPRSRKARRLARPRPSAARPSRFSSAPSVRGRKIFGAGGLLSRDPTYPAWRAGANAATLFKTEGAIDVGGLTVPAGNYTLYVWVKDPEQWDLIISKQTGQWGLTYSASADLGRVKMTMSRPPALVETLKYTLTDKGGGAGELRLEWEQHVATVSIHVK